MPAEINYNPFLKQFLYSGKWHSERTFALKSVDKEERMNILFLYEEIVINQLSQIQAKHSPLPFQPRIMLSVTQHISQSKSFT